MNEIYTANQPLCLGGPIYMWNRYANVGHVVWMPEAQYTKAGWHGRIQGIDRDGTLRWWVVPVKDRYLRPIEECIIHEPKRTFEKLLSYFDQQYCKYHHYQVRREYLIVLFNTLLGQMARPELCLDQMSLLFHSWIKSELGLDFKEYTSRKLIGKRPENPSQWVADMGAAINCKLYVGGASAQAAYLQDEHFAYHGMKYVGQNFKMKPYIRWKDAKCDNATISILDPLFIGGSDLVLELISGPAW